MSAPPSYEEAAGSSSGPPPAHQGNATYMSAAEEKAQLAQKKSKKGQVTDKRLLIWHAPTGNSLITAADEKTPIYNIIDSRAPDEAEQKRLSEQAHKQAEAYRQSHGKADMQRQDPSSTVDPPDVQFAKQVQASRAGLTTGYMKPSEIWTQTFRRDGDRNSEPIGLVKRHINTSSAVAIRLHDQKFGIEQHAGFPHRTYEFTFGGRVFKWSRTHSAPNTSKLDSGSFVLRQNKTIYAYCTDEDDRCDGTIWFEELAIQEGLVDVVALTGYIMRDLDGERKNASYMRNPYGYGPYGSPYGMGYGFYPMPLLMPMPLLF